MFRIHPFYDGNGRVCRLASVLLLQKSGHQNNRPCGIWKRNYTANVAAHEFAATLNTSMGQLGTRNLTTSVLYVRFWLKMLTDSYLRLNAQRDRLQLMLEA